MTSVKELGPIAKLQDPHTAIDCECKAMLEAADAYEAHARRLDEEAERLRKLAREAREQEANLRAMTERSYHPNLDGSGAFACPRCGSECRRRYIGRYNERLWWSCSQCTWDEKDG